MNRETCVPGSVLLLVFMATAAAGSPGDDWLQWAGPNFNLTIRDAGVFDRGAFDLEPVWVRPLGSAYSGIAVADGKLITAFSDGTSDLLAALDEATGEEIWRYRIGPVYKGHDGSHDGPNSTPLVHGGRVYGLGPWGRLFALRLGDGKEVFSHKVDEEYGARAPIHGFTTAPTLVDGVLVVQTGGPEGHAISGFHPDSGELLWHTGNDRVEYQSPMALGLDGTTLVLAVTSESVLGLVPQTGEVLFRHVLPAEADYVATQPVPLGDGKVLLLGRRRSGLYQVSKTDGGYEIAEVWTTRGLRGTYTIPVPYEGHLYGYSGNFLTCIDAATGETVWKSRPPGLGTLALVDGRLFIQLRSGDLVVAGASSEGFREETRLAALDGGSLTAPSFAGGRFYVRNLTQIASVGVIDRVATKAGGASKPEIELYGQFAHFIERVEAAPSVEAKEKMIAELLESQESFPIIEGDRWVHFVYQGKVDDLALAGNFYMDESERVMGRIEGTDFYYRSVEVTPAAHYTYRFRVFGEPKLDPRNPRRVEGQRAPWSELVMPGWPEPKHIAEPGGRRGRLEELAWASGKLGNERNVQVYLPAGYDESSERYPLLVVNEGNEALRFGKMANSLDNLIGEDVAPIVVAFVPALSLRDYVSVTGLANLTEAMVSELLPRLQSKFRLLTEPGSHGIMGRSFGASHAIYAALKHPEVFGCVAAQSYFAYRSKDDVTAMLEEGQGKGLRVFVELNTNDIPFGPWADPKQESRELVERLREGGAEVTTHQVADGPDWSSWRSRTDLILATLFPKG